MSGLVVEDAGAEPAGVELDHLVIVAQTLAQGVQWCEARLGVTPGPGGTHALMGTHNRLFSISSPAHPRAYAEVIAIDPAAPEPGRRRWFGMDDAALQAAVASSPRLVHAVARTTRLDFHRAAMQAAAAHADPGPPIALRRASADGELRWRLTVRGDGALPHGGAVPTLIEWDGPQPGRLLPPGGVRLTALQVAAAPDELALLAAVHAALGWRGVERVAAPSGPPLLNATLETPCGRVTLSSDGSVR